jgi:hypothetical protein
VHTTFVVPIGNELPEDGEQLIVSGSKPPATPGFANTTLTARPVKD